VSISVAVAAGGTGGHLFPALAVADAIRTLRPDAQLTFIGSSRHLDRALLESRDVRIEATPVTSYASRRDLPAMTWRLARGVMQARGILRVVRADAVIGFGGYPSLPAILAAATLRIPRLVHEANAHERLGLANRLGARTGAEICGGFPTTGRALGRPVRICGVPLRPAIAALDRSARRADGRRRFERSGSATVVLCLGGSLGARRINAAAASLAERGMPEGWELIVSTGATDHASTAGSVTARDRIRLEAFIDDMDLAYAAADVVVARAGASTVAELEHLGLRAVLVPLPIAREGEQDGNAAALVARGGATIVTDASLDAGTLRAAVTALLAAPEPPPDPRHAAAARELAERIIELAEARR
jgi:UDP-N-acetylglucosamine--N-acetylmuramyl-(pentapeptide) pyrophosphoryl-undecaprenol N-acetylglucosamine transferase